MNKILLSGRLTKDAELGYLTTGTAKLQYTIAVERNYQKDKNNKVVDFISCEMLGKHCEGLHQWLTKGKLIIVEGELNIDKYEKDGEHKSFTKVKVDRLEFVPTGNSEKKDDVKSFEEIDDSFIPF